MLEALESEITEFFSIQPDAVYVVGGLSSFERLLAHACSAYNFLQSNSKWFRKYCTVRTLRIAQINTFRYSFY